METIAAISTAMGTGGIGIVRMSGKECFFILEKLFIPQKKEPIEEIKGYTIKYGHIVHADTKEKIDEVLVLYFKAPKSYTTEDMCEIHSHGSTIILKMILEECLRNGAMLADAGEFTKRAFLNGRIDLSQAESVIDLIHSKTEKEAKASMKQLEGFLSRHIHKIQKELLDIMADINASIDYPEYDIEETTNEVAMQRLSKVKKELEELKNSFTTGKILKEGIKTVIVGKPNAGKSSLLNTILKEERAIVSDIPGTTRDTIEEFVTIEGIPLRLIDTAGIRKTKDVIEEMGVKKALALAEEADLVIQILDATKPLEEEDKQIMEKLEQQKTIFLLNKVDITHENDEIENFIKNKGNNIIKISTRTREGIKCFYDEIVNRFHFNEIEVEQGEIITNIRQKEQVERAMDRIEGAMRSIQNTMPIDIIAIDIKETLEELGKITGDNVTEDIINEIFSKFCLGK